jgi:AcrR family transcriptional regulator
VRARKFACTQISWKAGIVTRPPGLREQKKQATREALREAALRLAVERGPDQVRVEDIAEAAGVSPRTYNNYFASREQAIVAAVTADREEKIAAAIAAAPADVRLSEAITEAVVQQYTNTAQHDENVLLLITSRTPLRDAFLDTTAEIEPPLTAAIAARIHDPEADTTARVLAASVAAAVRIALEGWLLPISASATAGGLVVPSGSLPARLRAALTPLAPALDAAEGAGSA